MTKKLKKFKQANKTENLTFQSTKQTSDYGGQKHWIIKDSTFIHLCKENCNDIYDTLTLDSGMVKKFPKGTLNRVKRTGTDLKNGRELFEFCADNTPIEWGMSIDKIGEDTIVKVFSSGKSDEIAFSPSVNLVQFIHSHPNSPNNGELSIQDMSMAKYKSDNVKYTLYYDRKYRGFTYQGFNEGEYWEPNP